MPRTFENRPIWSHCWWWWHCSVKTSEKRANEKLPDCQISGRKWNKFNLFKRSTNKFGNLECTFNCPVPRFSSQIRPAMELFSRRRWRLDRPKQKAVVFVLNPKNYATRAWHNSIVVWLLDQSRCWSLSTKELHGPENSKKQGRLYSLPMGRQVIIQRHFWLEPTLVESPSQIFIN